MKHTPAPWTVNTTDYTNGIGIECVVNGICHTVCTDQFCYPNFQQHGSEEKLANAKLIAAAPELLEACISMEKNYREMAHAIGEEGLLPEDTLSLIHI